MDLLTENLMNDKILKDAAPAYFPNLLSRMWYQFGLGISTLTMVFGFSMRVKGSHNVPQSGPVLVISNHQSFLDPMVVGVPLQRHLVFLARKSLFHNPLF